MGLTVKMLLATNNSRVEPMFDLEGKRSQNVLLLRLTPAVYEKNDHPIGYRPPYTLKYIEAILREKKDCFVRCIDQKITSLKHFEIESEIQNVRPQIIIFDITTLNMEASNRLCRFIKKDSVLGGIVIIAIGQEVSAQVINFRKNHPRYDICLAGEVELEVILILEKLGQGLSVEDINRDYERKGLENKKWIVENLDVLPFLYFDQSSLEKYNFVYPLRIAKKLVWGHLITSRGCPHPCIFCSQLMRESYSTRMRYRSAGSVVNEIEHLLKLGVNIIAFDDEDFTPSKKHVSAICHEIIRRNLRFSWIIHGRVDELDEKLLELLSQSGCVLIRVGIETGNQRVLALLEKTKKNEKWFEQSEKVVKKAKSIGISVACLFMVGSPTETKEEVQESIDFAKKLNPEIIQVSYFTPFPGTKVYELFESKIKEFEVKDFYHYDVPKINLSGMYDDDLRDAQKLFYREFLLRPSFIFKHFFNNFFFYLRNLDVFLRLLKSIKQIH